MATGNIIDAKLRIAAEVAQAIKDLRALKAELLSTGKAADGAGGSGGSGGAGAAAKSETDQVVSQVKRRSQAERDAATEAKRLAKEQSDAEKAAARERRRIADEEAKRKKGADDEEKRRLKAADDAKAKAARNKAYQGAALAPQLNDVFVGLSTGQSALQVALQQGPQITQIYGGVANTFRALLSVLTPVRVAIGAVAGGFLLAAGNIAAGYRESSQLNKQLALSGNIAGTSLGQINSLALDISNKTGQSIGFVRDALAAVLSISGQTDTTLGSTTRAVSALAKLTGQSAEEAVKGFADQADGITQWATKSNKAYNFLTAEQVRYIRTLEQQGRIAEAIKFTNDELAKSLEQRGVQAIGSIERAWNAAGRAVSFFLDQLKSIGRDDTAVQKLQRLQAQLAEVEARLAQPSVAGRRKSTDEANRKRIQAEIASLNRTSLNGSEDAAALRAEQERIQKEGKEFQAILATQEAAAAQKKLAVRQAGLDNEAAAVQAAYAQELISASDQALKLNTIDLQRAVAQEALAKRELQIEQGRTASLETKQEVEAQKATLTALEARVIEAKAKVNVTLAEGSRLIDAEAARLNDVTRQRNAANALDTIPRTVADPGERARQTAEAATSQARKEVADLQRDLNSLQETAARVPGAALLVPKLEAELAAARQGLAELQRKTELDSLFTQANEQLAQLALAEQQLDQQVTQGALSTEQAEQAKQAARRKSLEQLQQIAQLQARLALSPDEQAALGRLGITIGELKDQSTEAEKTLRTSVRSGFADAFVSVADGSKSALRAVKDFVAGVGRSMLDLIGRRLGEQLVNSLFGSNTGTGGNQGLLAGLLKAFVGAAGSSSSTTASVKHSGGVIGGSISRVGRAVSPLVFAGAQVLHSGGVAGLASGEVPAILQAGEEVLTSKDPRHVNNFRGGGISMQTAITINSSGGGTDQDLAAQANDLDKRIRLTVEQWHADQSRQGGKFSGGRRG